MISLYSEVRRARLVAVEAAPWPKFLIARLVVLLTQNCATKYIAISRPSPRSARGSLRQASCLRPSESEPQQPTTKCRGRRTRSSHSLRVLVPVRHADLFPPATHSLLRLRRSSNLGEPVIPALVTPAQRGAPPVPLSRRQPASAAHHVWCLQGCVVGWPPATSSVRSVLRVSHVLCVSVFVRALGYFFPAPYFLSLDVVFRGLGAAPYFGITYSCSIRP